MISPAASTVESQVIANHIFLKQLCNKTVFIRAQFHPSYISNNWHIGSAHRFSKVQKQIDRNNVFKWTRLSCQWYLWARRITKLLWHWQWVSRDKIPDSATGKNGNWSQNDISSNLWTSLVFMRMYKCAAKRCLALALMDCISLAFSSILCSKVPWACLRFFFARDSPFLGLYMIMHPLSPNAKLFNSSTIHIMCHLVKPELTQLLQILATKHRLPNVASLLQKCKDKHQLKQVHAHMIATGLIQYPPAASKLVAAFALSTVFGTTSTARSIAERVRGLDSYTWNTIIRGYLEENKPKNAFLVYSCMRKKALQGDTYTLMFVTKACGLISLTLGEQIHVQICKLGFESEIIIQTALLKVYALFGELSDMDQLFDEMPHRDMVTWSSLIAVYAQHNSHFKVLELLRAMVYNGLRPNESTAVSMLSAFSSLKALREGKVVHCFAVRNFVNLDVFVYNALIWHVFKMCEFAIRSSDF
ncbi:hypothetical protein Patl1_17820 [Pistacia atlantica]|uniref:Uncharacterized protein n=1 Tax=Pistacia atlantica TaxID=434234 RepID=A0ACC1C3I9_9ROSI|nr:hypothetical protein Patl1_17820 [Pistacia atlantica]